MAQCPRARAAALSGEWRVPPAGSLITHCPPSTTRPPAYLQLTYSFECKYSKKANFFFKKWLKKEQESVHCSTPLVSGGRHAPGHSVPSSFLQRADKTMVSWSEQQSGGATSTTKTGHTAEDDRGCMKMKRCKLPAPEAPPRSRGRAVTLMVSDINK